jgi:hypothetical protein
MACRSSSNSRSQSGQFIDSAAQGLRYVGTTCSGVTDANGHHAFNPGDEVCFFLGQLELAGSGVLRAWNPLVKT